jgi:hypothetical protein
MPDRDERISFCHPDPLDVESMILERDSGSVLFYRKMHAIIRRRISNYYEPRKEERK